MRKAAVLTVVLAVSALAALTAAYPGYREVACEFNGTAYGSAPLIRWQRSVADDRGTGISRNWTFTDSFDRTFALNSTLYHLFQRYHGIRYSYALMSGKSGGRAEGYVEVNHTYARASRTPSRGSTRRCTSTASACGDERLLAHPATFSTPRFCGEVAR